MPYAPPTGIPAPGFGIDNTAPAYPSPWNDSVVGFYFIDAATGSDVNRTYGHPGAPRATIPTNLDAGSVVRVIGNYPTPSTITSSGTAANPVFIRGDSTVRSTMTAPNTFAGKNYVIEHLNWNVSTGDHTMVALYGQNGAIRYGDVQGNLTQVTAAGISLAGVSSNRSSSLVVYGVTVHHVGDQANEADVDVHGITIAGSSAAAFADHLYVLDSTFHNCAGDGVQINARKASHSTDLHHVYIGRCTASTNRQSGFWAKQAEHVIMSENTVKDITQSPSSPGTGLGAQYGTIHLWFINNRVSSCLRGIHIASRSTGGDTGSSLSSAVYMVGNVIFDITRNSTYSLTDKNAPAAITTWDYPSRYYVNNTMWNCCAGIKHDAAGLSGRVHVVNNIIGQPAVAGDRTIWFGQIGDNNSTASWMHNNVVIGGGNENISWNGDGLQTLATFSTNNSGRGDNCSSASPTFVDAANKDFRLSSGDVVAQNTGSTHPAYQLFQDTYGLSIAIDRSSVSRPVGSTWDIGAYEGGAVGGGSGDGSTFGTRFRGVLRFRRVA